MQEGCKIKHTGVKRLTQVHRSPAIKDQDSKIKERFGSLKAFHVLNSVFHIYEFCDTNFVYIFGEFAHIGIGVRLRGPYVLPHD